MAVDFYEDSVFKGATFADLQQGAGPLIVINASDLGGGVRFSFLQEYFDLLCSDLASFPVARAVPPRRPCRCCLRRLRWRTTPAVKGQGAAGCRMHSST